MSRCDATKHGDFVAYTNWGCRCFRAKVDWSNLKADIAKGTYKSRKIDATGTHRRIKALMWLGWTHADIARRMNVGRGAIGHIMKRDQIFSSTAARVAEVFEELSATPAPPSFGANRAKSTARRNNYAPPLAWDAIDDPRERPRYRD